MRVHDVMCPDDVSLVIAYISNVRAKKEKYGWYVSLFLQSFNFDYGSKAIGIEF